MYIYLYIIYNIIKIKKRAHPQGYTHTEGKTDTHQKLRVAFFVRIGSTDCCDRDFGRNLQPATCNLQLWLRFGFRFLVHICVVSSSSSAMFLVNSLLLLMIFAIFACVNMLTLKKQCHGIL